MNTMKLTATIAAVVSLLVTLIATPALADCDYEDHQLNIHRVVPEWSYSHVVVLPEGQAPYLHCEHEAEDVDCEAEFLFGLECAYKMQRLYSACVGREVCDDAAQGWLEDDGASGETLADMYGACLDLVAAAGGQY
jgi:hypothetical protein